MQYQWADSLDNVNWHDLADLYERAPLAKKDPDRLRVAFTNSLFRCFVRDGARLIGVGRALADGSDCSYICDVALLPEYQGQGLGKAIVNRLIELSADHKKIILYCVPGKEGFYKRLGFKRMTTAMAIFQNEELYMARRYISHD
jgi:ribosomal protein S18 acetylase RimI-like enzyme